MKIDISVESCTRCAKCVKVCPAKIFTQGADSSNIVISDQDNCIVCGHCVAVCPTDSVIHQDFSPEKVHKIDYSSMPTAEQILLLCRARRSNRAFSKRAVPKESLDLIVEAAHRAPTASNMQKVEFTLVTDPVIVDKVIDYTLSEFLSLASKLSNPFVKPLIRRFKPGIYRYIALVERMKEQRALGNDPILRGATSVLFIHSPKSSMFGEADCNLAYQNGSLMAESLGVSQVYTGFVCMGARRDKKNKLAKMLGIEGTIHAGMALGMPQFNYPKYIDKKEIKLNII